MADNSLNKNARKKRHLRVRKKVKGTPDRPRLNVYRSLRHIYAQLIDDVNGQTLVFASTLELETKDQAANKDAARQVGEMLGERALQNGVKKVVFDRGGYLYHGRVRALAEGARSQGLIF